MPKEDKWCPECGCFSSAKRFKAFRCGHCVKELGDPLKDLPKFLVEYYKNKKEAEKVKTPTKKVVKKATKKTAKKATKKVAKKAVKKVVLIEERRKPRKKAKKAAKKTTKKVAKKAAKKTVRKKAVKNAKKK